MAFIKSKLLKCQLYQTFKTKFYISLGKVYVLGSSNSNECEVLDTTNLNAGFVSIAQRPKEQFLSKICVVNTDLYLLGGCYTNKMVQKYDTEANVWQEMTNTKVEVEEENPCFVRGKYIWIYDSKSGKLLEVYKIQPIQTWIV